MPKISVIVPVYKVENYLRECVDSILAQTFEDFEVILVDDGSPDNCGAICDEYAQKDPRVRVIHQENQGLSGARNSGVDISEGEYITFIDSDDVVSRTFLETLFQAICHPGVGASCCRFLEFKTHEQIIQQNRDANGSVNILSGKDAVLSIYKADGEVSVTAWGKLFQRNLCMLHRFPVGKIHEDQAVVPMLLYEAKSIAVISTSDYYYRNRDGSITREKFRAKRFDNLEALDSCIAYFKDKHEDDIVYAARKTRKKVNGLLVILAESCGASSEIPEEYRLSRMRALFYCYKFASNDTYSWYLSKLYPEGIIYHEYFLKIKSILKNLLG